MHRMIAYFNALFLGVILGMVFLAISSPSAGREQTAVQHESALHRLVAHHPRLMSCSESLR